MPVPDNRLPRLIKPVVFCLCLIPLLALVLQAATNGLGANPVEKAIHRTGDWTLNCLLLTLAITPFVRVTGMAFAAGLRRMLGLYAFFYGTLHLVTYVALDQFFSLDAIAKDVVKHKRIAVGFIAYLFLIPLAFTSTNKSIKRMGAGAWKRLHRLVYLAAAGGVIHYLWLVKKDLTAPLIYAAVLLVLFLARWRQWTGAMAGHKGPD